MFDLRTRSWKVFIRQPHTKILTRLAVPRGCVKSGFRHVQTNFLSQAASICSHVELSGAPATRKSSRLIFPAKTSGVIPRRRVLHFGGSMNSGSQYTSARWKTSESVLYEIVLYDVQGNWFDQLVWKTVVALARKGLMIFSSASSSLGQGRTIKP